MIRLTVPMDKHSVVLSWWALREPNSRAMLPAGLDKSGHAPPYRSNTLRSLPRRGGRRPSVSRPLNSAISDIDRSVAIGSLAKYRHIPPWPDQVLPARARIEDDRVGWGHVNGMQRSTKSRLRPAEGDVGRGVASVDPCEPFLAKLEPIPAAPCRPHSRPRPSLRRLQMPRVSNGACLEHLPIGSSAPTSLASSTFR